MISINCCSLLLPLQFYGVTQTRPVYERAVEALKDDDARDICIQYTKLEQALGEIDRARAIMAHGSQFADPRRHVSYWNAWHEFEVAHGNEETFREMLRVKRSVQMAFRYIYIYI
jgi:pre-mRNA-splicing factor SYF1